MSEFPVTLPGASNDNTLMWAHPHQVEPAALDQLRTMSRLPWVDRLRVMPDVHLGKGATVGSVIAMRDAVSPSAVGVDIGCGMAAVRTSLSLADLPDTLHGLRLAIEAAVPVGYNGNDGSAAILRQDVRLAQGVDQLFDRFDGLRARGIADRESRALSQCGSLGGGNHFIELCAAEGDERLWLTLHSGSRNIGKELAERHISAAKTLEHNLGLPDRDLAVFLAGTDEMQAYLNDLWWAQDYALVSRTIMLATVQRVLTDWWAQQGGESVRFDEAILCHHNYVARETYDDVELIVTLGEATGSVELAGDSAFDGTPGDSTDYEPSAGWFGDTALVLLTWGSSTCLPIIDSAEAEGDEGTVTFVSESRMCTMDMVPRSTIIDFGDIGRTSGEPFVLTLVGDNLDATLQVAER